jgi:lipoprotein-releasing system ATP-binding protein
LSEGEKRGSLHSATDGEAVRRSGRDDESFVAGRGEQPTLRKSAKDGPPNAAGGPVMLRAEGLTKVYPAVAGTGGKGAEGDGARDEVVLFRGLDFSVAAGEMVAIVGESGSGKSSLLHLLAALDRPTAGDVWVGETRVGGLNARQAAEFRNREVGYVWQFHYLLPEFTALENVAMPLLARGERRPEALEKARGWLAEVGLGARVGHRSGELSGGEQQRVSLARALVTGPKLLLADEPTGDLDGKTAEVVFALIQNLHGKHPLTSVVVTHNMEFAVRCGRVLRLRGGRLEEIAPTRPEVAD